MDAKTFLESYVPLFAGLSQDHLVAVGKLTVHAKVPNKGVVQVAELGQGDVFGEASIFESGTASAAVKAATDAQVLVIPQEAFRRVLAENPAFGERVKALIASRRAAPQA